MATSLTSDTYHEFACTFCAEQDINKEAFVFCVNCSQYFCKPCLRFHNRVADAAQHQLLDKDKFQNFSTSVNKGGKPDLPTEKCQIHHGKLVDMYCEDDDQIGCNVCMTLKHRQCKQLHYIPDIASSLLSQKTIQAVSKNLSDRLDEFKTLKQDRLDTKTRVANEKDACLNSIKERRKAINEYLDQTENTYNKSVTDKHNEIRAKLDEDLKTCDDSISLLDTMKGNLQTPGSNNLSQTFIDLKRAENSIKDTEAKLGDCKGNKNDTYTIFCEAEYTVNDILSPDRLFGNVKSGYRAALNALKKEKDINVRLNSDKSVCDCNDLCQLPDGTIIITDWNNKNLKSLKYDNTYKQSDSLSMSNSPWGVCTVNDNEVAVTVPVDKKVSIVSVSPKLAVKSSFKVDSNCYGIAYAEGHLYVGHNSKLAVYDLAGKNLKTFSESMKNPCHLYKNPKKPEIIFVDEDKCKTLMIESGELESRYMGPNKGWIRGVCMDDSGNVYFSDNRSNQLLVQTTDESVNTLQNKLISSPLAVLFDEHSKRLFVTYWDENHIQSFSLHYDVI